MTSPDRPTLVLASGSPRRRDLLARFGVPFDVRPADVDETPGAGEAPADLVRRLAAAKAEAALAAAPEADVAVLAADTVVVVDGLVLGKPVDDADAARMLRLLADRTHVVLTGIAVGRRGPGTAGLAPAVALAVEVEATEVTFTPLTDAEIAWYVGTGEPRDKAGAYGIQGRGGLFVASIRGSHDNVVGLGLATARRLLLDAGVDPLAGAR